MKSKGKFSVRTNRWYDLCNENFHREKPASLEKNFLSIANQWSSLDSNGFFFLWSYGNVHRFFSRWACLEKLSLKERFWSDRNEPLMKEKEDHRQVRRKIPWKISSFYVDHRIQFTRIFIFIDWFFLFDNRSLLVIVLSRTLSSQMIDTFKLLEFFSLLLNGNKKMRYCFSIQPDISVRCDRIQVLQSFQFNLIWSY